MVQRHRKFFSYTVLAGMIFNLLSPLFLLPWQKVWACFGAWDCDGNSYCAGAGSYPDHPGSCASYGERGNNDRTTSEIAQDYINSGGNPAEVVTRTSDFQGRSSNDDAAAAAAKAQELAVAEAQRIAAEQAAAASAAANAAAAKAADDQAKAEAQRLAQEAAERSARAAANAATAATAMTAINAAAAAPAGTPAVGATVPAAAAPAAAGAACGSSLHNACSPNSDGNWYKCVNGSWQKDDVCKPAGSINCAIPMCAGANGCVDPGAYGKNGQDICEAGRWHKAGTKQQDLPQQPDAGSEAPDAAVVQIPVTDVNPAKLSGLLPPVELAAIQAEAPLPSPVPIPLPVKVYTEEESRQRVQELLADEANAAVNEIQQRYFRPDLSFRACAEKFQQLGETDIRAGCEDAHDAVRRQLEQKAVTEMTSRGYSAANAQQVVSDLQTDYQTAVVRAAEKAAAAELERREQAATVNVLISGSPADLRRECTRLSGDEIDCLHVLHAPAVRQELVNSLSPENRDKVRGIEEEDKKIDQAAAIILDDQKLIAECLASHPGSESICSDRVDVLRRQKTDELAGSLEYFDPAEVRRQIDTQVALQTSYREYVNVSDKKLTAECLASHPGSESICTDRAEALRVAVLDRLPDELKPQAKQARAAVVEAERFLKQQQQAPESTPRIETRGAEKTTFVCEGDVLIKTTERNVRGVFGQAGSITQKSVETEVCEWGCVGGACRPPTMQETAAIRMDVINNAIDQARVRCQRSGRTNCDDTAAIYQDAMQNVDAGEPSQVQAEIIRNTASQLSAGDKNALIDQEYQNLRSSILQAQAAGSGQGFSFGAVGLTAEDEAGLRQRAEENVDRILASGNVDAGGGNILTADSNKWDMISNLPVDQAEAIIKAQKGANVAGIEIPGLGRTIATEMFCSLNSDYRASHPYECEADSWLPKFVTGETAQSFWSFLISGKSEQKIWDQGMEFGDARSAAFQVQKYNDNVAPECGVYTAQRELTAEETDCLTVQIVAALYKWDTVDEQNQVNAALNVTSAALGFAGGAVGAGIKATGLVGKATTVVLRSGVVSDLVLVPAFAETMTVGDRAEADVLTALAEADGISDDQRAMRQARAETAQASADTAYTENVISSIVAVTAMNLGGEALGSVARRAIGDTPFGRLLLGNLPPAARQGAAQEVADALNSEVIAPASLFPNPVSRRVVSAEEVIAGVNKAKVGLSGNPAEALASPGVVAGANVPVGEEVGGVVTTVRTAVAGRQGIGGIADRAADTAAAISYDAAVIVDRVGNAIGEAFDAAKIRITGQGTPVEVDMSNPEIFATTSIRVPEAVIQPLPIENVPRRIIDPNTLTDKINPSLSSTADVYKLKLEIDGTETPVIVKVLKYDDFVPFAKEVNQAQITDQLGIGPGFHGIADLGDGRLAYIIDEIPGATSKPMASEPIFGKYVTRQALEDVRVIEARLIDNGFALGGDFEVMITPDGRAVMIDPTVLRTEGLSPERIARTREVIDKQIRILMEARAESQGVPGLVANAVDSWSGASKGRTKVEVAVSGPGGITGAVSDAISGATTGIRNAAENTGKAVGDLADSVSGKKPESLVEHLTGVKYDDPSLPQRIVDDHFAIKQKYDLPDRGQRFEGDMAEYIRKLEGIAKENGIPVRDKSEFAGFFEEYVLAGALYDNKGKQIFIDFSADPLKRAGDLEHELIHALQDKRYPSMPFEVKEYEAYVGANTSIDSDILSDPENVEMVFAQIGLSSEHAYKSEGLIVPWGRKETFVDKFRNAAETMAKGANVLTESVTEAVGGATAAARNAAENLELRGFRDENGNWQFPVGREPLGPSNIPTNSKLYETRSSDIARKIDDSFLELTSESPQPSRVGQHVTGYIFEGREVYNFGEINAAEAISATVRSKNSTDPVAILDVGVGNGSFIRHVKEVYGNDVSVSGLTAHDYRTSSNPLTGFDYRLGNAEHLLNVYPENSFDVVVSNVTVRHFRDPLGGVVQMYEALKPNGTLLVDGFGTPGLEGKLRSVIDFLRSKGYQVVASFEIDPGLKIADGEIKYLIIRKTHEHLDLPVGYGGVNEDGNVIYQLTGELSSVTEDRGFTYLSSRKPDKYGWDPLPHYRDFRDDASQEWMKKRWQQQLDDAKNSGANWWEMRNLKEQQQAVEKAIEIYKKDSGELLKDANKIIGVEAPEDAVNPAGPRGGTEGEDFSSLHVDSQNRMLNEISDATSEQATTEIGGLKGKQLVEYIRADLETKGVEIREGGILINPRVASKGFKVVQDINSLSELYINFSNNPAKAVHEWLHVKQIEALLNQGIPTSVVEEQSFVKIFDEPSYSLGTRTALRNLDPYNSFIQSTGLGITKSGLIPTVSAFNRFLDDVISLPKKLFGGGDSPPTAPASGPAAVSAGFREGEVFGPKGPLDFDLRGFEDENGNWQFPIGRPKPADAEISVKPGSEGVGGKVRNAVGEAGERIGQAVDGVREKILPSKMTISEPEWNEKTIGIDGLQTEVDSLVRQAKDQGMPPGTKITISYFGDDLKLKTINTKLESLATAIRNAIENNQFGTQFGDLDIKFGNSSIELGSVSNLSDPQNIVWNVRDIPTKAELSYLITHSADFRKKVVLARDLGVIGFAGAVGAAIGTTGAEVGAYYYVKPTVDRVPLKDPEAAFRDARNLPPNDFRCVGNQIVEVSAVTGEVLKTLETCQSGCSLGMCQAKEDAACRPGEHLKVSDSSESCSLSCVSGVYAKDFAQCDSIDLSGISTNRYREVVMRTLSVLPDDFFPVEKFDKLSIYEVPLAYFSRGDIGDFSPEVNWRDQETELNGMASISGEHFLIGRESLSEGLVSGVSGTLIHELLHLWAYQSIKPLPEKMPYSYVASAVANTLIGPEGTPFGYESVTGCLAGGAGGAFHDQPVDARADNCQEDFAYAGTRYVLEACQLKSYSPERYEYFKSEVFGGKEYIPESGCPSQ